MPLIPDLPSINRMLHWENFFPISFSLVAASMVVEGLRAGGSPYNFGLAFDKFTLGYIVKGLVIVLISCFIYLVLGLMFGAELVVNTENLISLGSLNLIITILFQSSWEEFAFRGVIMQSIESKTNSTIAILISSLLFAFVHGNNPNISWISLSNIFFAGVFMAAMYVATRSLWISISFHFFWNYLTAVLVGSEVSGVDFGNVYILDLNKSNMSLVGEFLIGGNFGIEEGFIATLILIFFTYYGFKNFKSSPYMVSKLFNRKYEESRLINR